MYEGSPAFPPGSEWFSVDVNRLPKGSVVYDNNPPGHVCIMNQPPEVVKAAILTKGKIPKA